MRRTGPTSTAILAACCGTLLLTPALAQAHISLHPNTIPEGAFVTLNVRVPGEEEGAYAYKVDTLMPEGFTDVDTQNLPGWSVKKVIKKLSTPIQTSGGPVDEEISEIIWTGDRSKLGRLENGAFIQFPLSIAMPEGHSGQSLVFKTLEYYSNGKVIHWIGPPTAAYPAPTINITAKGGVIQEVAGGEAGPTPGEVPSTDATTAAASSAKASSGASEGLAVTALIVGILGLLAGLGAIVSVRRRSSVRAPGASGDVV
jgi:periplasmic copper chaperone A